VLLEWPSAFVDGTQNNNLAEIIFDLALLRAGELGRYQEEHQPTIGPPHGLPVSLKDQFHVKRGNASMAYVGRIGKERLVESELVKELLSFGAIPMTKVRCSRST
jgi:amidase